MRFYSTVDLVNELEREKREGKAGRIALALMRLDLVILDELRNLPFSQAGGTLLFHLSAPTHGRTRGRVVDFAVPMINTLLAPASGPIVACCRVGGYPLMSTPSRWTTAAPMRAWMAAA